MVSALIDYPKLDQLIIYRGLEKEALRVQPNGRISMQAHPAALGSALKNPVITTDFSESLTEIITGVHDNIDAMLQELADTNTFLVQHCPESEYLWAASMPPAIDDERNIPIAQYGSSHIAQMKHWYRVGLANRYGRIMQSIAGIHYNISFNPDLFLAIAQQQNQSFNSLQSAQSYFYMKLIRQFLAQDWLLILLFSAAPIAANTSISQPGDFFHRYNNDISIGPHATSLRLSPLGYQNQEVHPGLIDHSSIENYAADLFHTTHTPSQYYNELPALFHPKAKQLNTNILQIDNEYYSNIRPKPKFISEQTPSLLLYQNGIEYIEIRLFDLNPYQPLGVTASQLAFTDVFCTHCLLQPEVTLTQDQIQSNRNTITKFGLDRNQTLHHEDQLKATPTVASDKLNQLLLTAQWMDQHTAQPTYTTAVLEQQQKIQDWDHFIAQRLLEHKDDYHQHILSLSQSHHNYFQQRTLSPDTKNKLQAIANDSAQQQKELEANNANSSFADYYQHYINLNACLNKKIKSE